MHKNNLKNLHHSTFTNKQERIYKYLNHIYIYKGEHTNEYIYSKYKKQL